MKKVITSFLLAGIILLLFSFGILYLSVLFFPKLSEEYYSPIFATGKGRNSLYFIHPFIVAIAIKYFWQRFKSLFKGNFIMRGIEVGFIYGLIAVVPTMWIIFSAMKISAGMAISWVVYGFLQAMITGIVYAKTNP